MKRHHARREIPCGKAVYGTARRPEWMERYREALVTAGVDLQGFGAGIRPRRLLTVDTSDFVALRHWLRALDGVGAVALVVERIGGGPLDAGDWRRLTTGQPNAELETDRRGYAHHLRHWPDGVGATTVFDVSARPDALAGLIERFARNVEILCPTTVGGWDERPAGKGEETPRSKLAARVSEKVQDALAETRKPEPPGAGPVKARLNKLRSEYEWLGVKPTDNATLRRRGQIEDEMRKLSKKLEG